MNRLLHKYSAWVLKWLAPLGPWGVFAIAALDSAALGMPVDALVAGFVYARPQLFWLFALMASAGSALGSLVVYGVGYEGEQVLLRRTSQQRLDALRERFARQEFLALMIPAILPPPTPFKLFVLAAGAFRMRVSKFLLAIFAGRMVRFLTLSLIVLYFGPKIVRDLNEAFRAHFWMSLAVLVALVAGGALLWRKPWRKVSLRG